MLIDSKTIGGDDVDIYRSSEYRVKTIVPYLENPKMNTYLFDQGELDQFLKDYENFAEFIVSVKQVVAKA